MIWAAPRLAHHFGANGSIALWICVLNPLVLIHLMGGVHNEMLMVGLMAAGIALTFQGRHVLGVALIAVAIAVKATAGIALPFMVWVWMRHLRDKRGYRAPQAFLLATAISLVIFAAVFGILTAVAGVGLGWLAALAGSVKIINALSLPTLAANLIHALGSGFFPVNFYPVLRVTRYIGIAIIAVSLPAVVVAVPARRPGRIDRYRVVDVDRGAVRPRRPAVVLLLAAGGGCPVDAVTAGDGGHRRVLDMGDGDFQSRWIAGHVFVAACYRWPPHADWSPGTSCTASRTPAPKSLLRKRKRKPRLSTPWLVLGARLPGLGGRAARRRDARCSMASRSPSRVIVKRRVGGEQPAHNLGLVIAAVVQDRQQSRQAFDHLTGIAEEDLWHHHATGAPHREQVTLAQLLRNLADRNTE